MGERIAARTYSPEDRLRYRDKVQRSLEALSLMLQRDSFSFGVRHIGLEIELNLVTDTLDPAMCNGPVLDQIADPAWQTELGQHNIEINVAPRPLAGDEALGLEDDLRTALNTADRKAREAGAALAMIGMLPTLREEHFDLRWLSVNPRYSVLNEQIFAERREEMVLDVEGVPLVGSSPERLHVSTDSILPEAACTSVQLHLQVEPEEFAAHWNAAQCLAGVQVALAANSPFLLQKALWQETRIPVFQQATDTRPPELRNQGVRPRVWFGERFITSIFDLFEENVRYFPPLLPEVTDEDPLEVLQNGGAPSMAELRLHNGTVWRWNRPIYDRDSDGVPHLRVENRVLPAGPTVIDTMANAALFYGAVRALTDSERPVWTQMSFDAAEDNLANGARYGMDARLYWPGTGWVPPDELVLRKLLPLAHEGLRSSGVSAAAVDRYLGVVEARCTARRTGSTWQRDTVRALTEAGADRASALRGMLRRYLERMHSNEPVHTWPVD